VTLSEELGVDMKNPLGLNQAEIIAGLALELVKNSKRVISPITKQPFRVKFGKYLCCCFFFLSELMQMLIRFSFRSSCWWNCWGEKFSILSVW